MAKQESLTIPKHPELEKSQDYYWLRQKGIEYIRDLGSKLWTDYNIHDPGITQLEVLCYALTDLAHRTSFEIKDLLAHKPDEYPANARQAFFPAPEILTMNPLSINDYRKLLIDIEGVKNGWLLKKICPCEAFYLYVNCSESRLQYKPKTGTKISPKGLYDALVEFDDAEGLGDLNSGKILHDFGFEVDGVYTQALMEIRLPSWRQLQKRLAPEYPEQNDYKNLLQPNSEITEVEVKYISGNKADNVDAPPESHAKLLKDVVYATVKLTFKPNAVYPGTLEIELKDIPLRVWFKSNAHRKALTWSDLKSALASDTTPSGLFPRYLKLIHSAQQVIETTRDGLHNHRNLCEDYCTISAVAVQDVAICADMEVEPAADIERVLAMAYFSIQQYFSPDIRFYSLKQLLDEGYTIDAIFNGPLLTKGFIKSEELEQTQLKQTVYTSDIINLLMDIEGIVAVKNILLTKFDQEGKQVGPSQSWELDIDPMHQPRLYLEASKFLVYKDNLPFLPDKSELLDTLQVIKGQHLQPRFSDRENKLPEPKGRYYNLTDYHPLQYSLPDTYGVGQNGLPGNASLEHKSKAKQLKGYLLFFEQLLVNYLYQLAHLKDLFALDSSVNKTYFTSLLSNTEIEGIEELTNGLDQTLLHNLLEGSNTFYDRRNRFLDHLMARFAERMNDYALMLYNYYEDKSLADSELIKTKISFAEDIPEMGHNRARAINYMKHPLPCDESNYSGLELRIKKLLGLNSFWNYVEIYEENDKDTVNFEKRWRLVDEKGKICLSSSTRYSEKEYYKSIKLAKKEILQVKKHMQNLQRYSIAKKKAWVLNLLDETDEVIATRKQHFKTKGDAEQARDQLIEFVKEISASEKVFVVEHVLLRPKFPKGSPELPDGDPLLTICVPQNCENCSQGDPYSFRLTVILNGELGLANSNIMFRRFAEKTIRREVPAHIGLKICWVSTEDLVKFEIAWCAWLNEVSKPESDPKLQSQLLKDLLDVFQHLKSLYPPAFLHDCIDGNDENRVYINQTIV